MVPATPSPPRAPSNGLWNAATATFAAAALPAFALYLATVSHTVPAGDSGELITAAATFGVAHPPGYPLYVWLGRLWLWVMPWGSAALRLNLFSGVCGALAAGWIAIAVRRLTGSAVAGVVAGLALAASGPQWKYSIVAEVFAPNAALAAAVLVAFVTLLASGAASGGQAPVAPRERRGSARPVRAVAPPHAATPPAVARRIRWPWVALGLLATLLLSLHHTLVLLAAPVLAVSLATPRLRPRGREWIAAAAAAAAGLVPLVQLPLASHVQSALVWGDATTLAGFLRQVLRADYGTFQLAPSGTGLAAHDPHGGLYLGSLASVFGLPAVLFAIAGAVVVALRQRPLALAIAGFVVAQAVFFARAGLPADVPVMRGVIERFYLLPDVVVALLAGIGFAAVAARLPRSLMVSVALAAVVVAPAWWLNRAAPGPRDNRFTERLGRSLLASVPERAVLFVRGDLEHNALEYLTRVERLRPDVTVVDQELLTYDWYVRQLRRRDAALLPPLGGAQRIRLREGSVIEGWAVRRAPGRVDLLLDDGNRTVDSADVVSIEPLDDPKRAFAATRAEFHLSWMLRDVDDRYSGLPGTRNLLWLDHLRDRRPAAFFGLKEDSWSLAYELVAEGLVARAYPRGAAPTLAAQAERALRLAPELALDDYFRDWAATSFESVERAPYAAFVTRTALLLCQPEASPLAHRPELAPGYQRLRSFAERYEALEPVPDTDCLRAIAFMRAYAAGIQDTVRARHDLDRFLAVAPAGAALDAARDLRSRLGE